MSPRQSEIREISNEIRVLAAALNARLDALNGRIDTVIDSLADLRRDFAEHEH